MTEIKLLCWLGNRERYDKYRVLVQDHTLTAEASCILNDMGKYMTTNEDDDIDWDAFCTWFLTVEHPVFKPEKVDLYRAIINNIATNEDEISSSIINVFIGRDYANRIYEVARGISEGSTSTDELDKIPELLDKYNAESKVVTEDESLFVDVDVKGLIEGTAAMDGLHWRLEWLERAMGPLTKGNFVVISSVPDGGKTTFLASEGTHMATQLSEEHPVLWFCNEEATDSVQLRTIQAALNKTFTELTSDPTLADESYKDLIGDKLLIFKEQSSLNVRTINKVVKDKQPGLIIIDQLRKIGGFSDSSEYIRLQKLFEWGRTLAQDYCPVLTVHQADATAVGTKFIEAHQLHGSKVDIQGACDAIVTIGRSLDPTEDASNRYIYIPKNKFRTAEEALRNGRFEVSIDKERARFTV